jgi:Galactose oxidase, central domain
MTMSIRPRKYSVIPYSFLFANLALLSACGGNSGGNNNGGGQQSGAPVIATAAPPSGTTNSAYSFTFMVSSGGQAPFTWSETGALPAGLTLASNGELSGTPTASGSFPITVKVDDSTSQTATKNVSIEIVPAPAFSFTGSMGTPRIFHTATLLSSGQVVIVGGEDNTGNAIATAETYEPPSGTFTPALTTLNNARYSHTATLIDAFDILIAGGTGLAGTSLSSAEIYDSETGSFNAAGSMTTARSQHTDTMLGDGTVLLAGGVDASGNALDSAEIYNPTTGTFTATGHMTIARFQHTATLLQAGKVLLAGGVDATGLTTATAEIYDPATHTFSATGSMSDSRAQHIATPIGGAGYLVAGGYSSDGQTVTTLASGQSFGSTAFSPLLSDMVEPRAQTTITSLSGSGLFILTGGAKFVLANCGNNCVTFVPQSLSSTEGFSSFDLDFFPEPSMNTARRGHTATLLADGNTILIVGGANSTLGARDEFVNTVLNSAELFH